MTMASAWSVALLGMDGTLVEVEAAVGAGLPRTVLVGLPDAALYEARDRCRAAVAGAGLSWPNQLLTINLTPASLPKAGSHYDLAIVAAVLGCSGVVPGQVMSTSVMLGELGLDGRVRPVRGILPAMMAARTAGLATAIVPSRQVNEARLVTGMTVWGVSCLDDLVEVLHGRPVLGQETPAASRECAGPVGPEPDLADVRGQPEACWALEVAAAGGHHLFLHGSPGVGKSMLAERLPGLLPDLTDDQALEVSAVHSLAGAVLHAGLIRRPPFASPHHNASMAALIGGGARLARPGAISLAHRGILFLDEAPEFSARVLDALRTPMETGEVTIARSSGQVRYPARFQLVLAANPCPCGMTGVRGACSCTPMSIRRYNERLSGPVLDRIDIHHQMLPAIAALSQSSPGDPTATVAGRVSEARLRQQQRLADTPWRSNAEVPGYFLRTLPAPQGMSLLDEAVSHARLSARGVDKVMRIAWTVADLRGGGKVTRTDLAMALGLRQGAWGCAA
ncbi:YifB family Mg chelatase-like AAA ATPase [Brooklawnia cerclae]|uniref:Magnesium chelatase family protein n=1 Tax=Brooklawnia cerclae TaxID=349934 RepID=A0ABX0SGA5_9ACTN|nr:YifB family Mg chelatase-like AAA ATPase [Brooklawnia cerclae]NIH57369.1 magnesium chelatase family protein [Brooklawnia cerclae]